MLLLRKPQITNCNAKLKAYLLSLRSYLPPFRREVGTQIGEKLPFRGSNLSYQFSASNKDFTSQLY